MTRLLAVAALAALVTGCAAPYGLHARGGAGGTPGMQGMEGHGRMHAQGHGGMQAQPGKKMGGCMHGMQQEADAAGKPGERHAGMHERMHGKGQGRMCEGKPAVEADAPQH